MTSHSTSGRHQTVDEVLDRVRRSGDDSELVVRFVERYLDDVDAVDLDHLDPDALCEAVLAHWELGRRRSPGTASVRVLNPEAHAGWEVPHTLVQYVTDDMPFLVDSVRAALTNRGLAIHLLVHPMLCVTRAADGTITEVASHQPAGRDGAGRVEGWTMIEIDRCDEGVAEAIAAEITAVLEDVRTAVADWEPMRRRAQSLADDLAPGGPVDRGGLHDRVADLLRWMAQNRFVFLGACRYTVDGDRRLHAVEGTGLGLLREPHDPDPPLPPEDDVLSILTADRRSPVHRPVHLSSVGIGRFDAEGRMVGQDRFVGLFTASAYRDSVLDIPYLRETALDVMDRAGFPPDSHTGRELRAVLESLPRDEFFELDPGDLYDLTMGVVGLQERRRVRVLQMREATERFVTVLVYLPRSRFTSAVGFQVARMVGDAYGAAEVEHDSEVGVSAVARIRVVVRRGDRHLEPDLEQLAERIDRATVGWSEQFRVELVQLLGEREGQRLRARWEAGIPPMYQAVVPPHVAVADLRRLESLQEDGELACALIQALDAPPEDWRFRVYRRGEPITLSAVLPLLEHLGVNVVDERPYRLRPRDGRDAWIYDIGIRIPQEVVIDVERDRGFREAFVSLFRGTTEDDGLNRLVLLAGLDSRQVSYLRAYAQYLRQSGFQFSYRTLDGVLTRYPALARGLVELFEARFRPEAGRPLADREVEAQRITTAIEEVLDSVPSLEEDRIGRALLTLVLATTRTNAFRPEGDRPGGRHRPVIALKFDPGRIPQLPEPRPRFEVFVSSPRVEGVHLRGGAVARGGIRWSDRRDDFRTEVLGLMKAQMVKNSVIVPVGAKGGFVVKRSPADRDALRVEVADCYRHFIEGLLDLTDNIIAGEVLPPPRTVRYDGDDPYLVVAADKGTATFSDLANEVAAEYGFWLGDAFASGGSAGYDHKAMGITARGAWESVRRHAITLGMDADHDPVSVVGIGDMSGDVFGNGMLLSRHLRLIAAFDHRHILLDPDPDPEVSYEERRRLFRLPGSSWADYNRDLLSAGGGVYPRTMKSIPLSPEVREALEIDDEVITPNELISAVLRAPVDLLWNGGVGTYVKASTEANADVGDRANDALRVDGGELRCRMVAEGGNLGFTQRGRVEYALSGGLINTDAIDNSAGVDCSDREVNIKVLLNAAVTDGELELEERNELLAAMTGEVAELVLADNTAQALALALARRNAASTLLADAYYLDQLETEGWLDRNLEALPTPREVANRNAAGAGLTMPELAVLLAYTKTACVDEILEAGRLADDPYLRRDLLDYFPSALRGRFAEGILKHPLRREIVLTRLVNDMVDITGITFDHWISEETGVPVTEVLRSWIAARDILDVGTIWADITAMGDVEPATRAEMRLDVRGMIERATLWLVRHERPPFELEEVVRRYRPHLRGLLAAVPEHVRGPLDDRLARLVERRTMLGVPPGLARASAGWSLIHAGFDQTRLAMEQGRSPEEVAAIYWALIPELDLTWLWNEVAVVQSGDRWETLARSALRDDVASAVIELTASVLRSGGSLEEWTAVNARRVDHVRELFGEIRRRAVFDMTTLSVATRQLHNLALV